MLACRSGFLTSFGALCAGLTSATVFSVACCAVPTWAGSLTILGVETSLAFAIEPYGPIASLLGIAALVVSALWIARDVGAGVSAPHVAIAARSAVMMSSVATAPFNAGRSPPRKARKSSVDTGLIEIDRVTVTFGKGRKAHKAIEETSIRVEPGEFVCILGPSGCGKSTLLNAVAGYVKPRQRPSPRRRRKGHAARARPRHGVPAILAVSVEDGAGQRRVRSAGCRPTVRRGRSGRATRFSTWSGLSRFAKRYPAELSGGMQQRVGIARALANYPRVLLMDEPFGALDAQTRQMMQENLLNIWSEFGTTVLFITHDIDEAIFLADRVLIMSAGPGRIIADLAVDLPRPRLPEVTAEPAFAELKRQCIARIRAESLKAFEQQNR